MNEIEKAIAYLKDAAKIAEKNNLKQEVFEETKNIISTAITALEKQKNGGWIPVWVRTPSEEECNKFDIMHTNRRKFLCTIKIGDREPQVRELYFTLFYNWSDGSESYDAFVIAWQPLPEPFKEVENE